MRWRGWYRGVECSQILNEQNECHVLLPPSKQIVLIETPNAQKSVGAITASIESSPAEPRFIGPP